MPRRTRKQLILVDEEREQYERDELCRRLTLHLHREWYLAASVWPHDRGDDMPIGVVETPKIIA
jgi:hypothetical protein